ncbi:MAG: NRDE family protein, partial [Alphaproteobacteria bacterium]
MCTLVLLRRPDSPWPLLVAANRDEMQSRSWLSPGRHWPDRPEIVAGQDTLAGGSGIGVNLHVLMDAVLNKTGK